MTASSAMSLIACWIRSTRVVSSSVGSAVMERRSPPRCTNRSSSDPGCRWPRTGSGHSGMLRQVRRVRAHRVDVHGEVVVECRQPLLEEAGCVAVVGDDVEAGGCHLRDQEAWALSRRVLPVLTIQRISRNVAVLGPHAVVVLRPTGVGQDRLSACRVVRVRSNAVSSHYGPRSDGPQFSSGALRERVVDLVVETSAVDRLRERLTEVVVRRTDRVSSDCWKYSAS